MLQCIQNTIQSERVDRATVLCESSVIRLQSKTDVNRMKRGFLVKKCTYALFESPQHGNEITKKHT